MHKVTGKYMHIHASFDFNLVFTYVDKITDKLAHTVKENEYVCITPVICDINTLV